ncbi:hypothetical protein CLI92_02450 [Vandammella animalimorsus]|uniref:Integrase catalytic domain-containing protein n=1 Tax=Vandammella animalimorsus TaxID=2029117 RepID=A0A2A2T9F1_9BURK|nr:hypothetical protein CK626_08750 [Vandammella animalimorsus]PAX18670.1 hypothetical protein CLI92_02450 [Vandammella animalimorsus]PAX20833.1 hypothetical protein CLI93_03875 [Vandammella animalimorsus]
MCALPKPYKPRTNGKAERFIQMLLREWAYVYAVVSKLSPTHRAGELAPWMLHHNIHRLHSALSTCLPLFG